MFDMLASGIGAFNQVGFLLGALLCAGLGAALLGNALYWSMHAARVQGEVIGVRQHGNLFSSVYRYTLPSGQSAEATSSEGSSSLRGRDTGTVCPLLVIPEHPDEVHEAASHVWTVVGAVLLAAGIWLFHVAISVWRVGPLTFAIGAVFLLHIALRLWHLLGPSEKRLGAVSRGSWSAWRVALAQRRTADRDASPIRRIEEIRATPEWRANEEKQRAAQRRAGPVLLALGLAMCTLGGYLARSLVSLESNGQRAPGVVIGLVMPNPGTKGAVYYPQVSFTAANGQSVEFRDGTGSNPPSLRIGAAVTVLYRPGDPTHAMIDRGLLNALPPAAAMLFGALLIIGGVRTVRAGRRDVRDI